MEWIPVFSLIVLVATIGTFIMSVSAYVMFKIRERRKQVHAPPRATRVEAEVVAPELATPTHGMPPRHAGQSRGSGQRLVQYTPVSHNEGGQQKDEQPAAWR